ncbi:MAG: glycosyltransferase family 39 protein [Victivallales bacterium]|nr:glycosyltransferase family 39 protein [Victivallales bacterium]
MALYKEKKINTVILILLLLTVFFAIFSPWRLAERELYWDEDYYAVQTLELKHTPSITFAHGEFTYDSNPLFPLIVSTLQSTFSLPVEFVLRLVSLLALAMIACLVWVSAKNAGGVQAAVVATSVMISSNIVIEKTIDGYPDTLTLLFLMLGWLLWFYFGVGRGKWNLAWILGFFFCGLAFYTQGFIAVLCFILPLVFMRRPMTIWPKLKKPGFAVGLFILLLFVLLWWLPHLIFAPEIEIRPLVFDGEDILSYLQHLALFPIAVVIRFLPWSVLAWVPFCVAFMPLDKSPIFSRFLRIWFFALFFALWFIPNFESRYMLLLVPPVAILIGINYGIFIQRYGRYFPKFYSYFGWLSFLCAGLVMGFYFAPEEWVVSVASFSRGIEFRNLASNQVNAYVGSGLMVVIGITLLLYRKTPIWMVILFFGFVPSLFLWSIVIPYKAQAHGKQNLGKQLREILQKENIPANEIIYKSAIKDLYGECYYMGYQVKKIYTLKELPENKEVIYLISTDYPQVPSREWTNLLPEKMQYRGRPIGFRRGVLKKRQFKKWPRR